MRRAKGQLREEIEEHITLLALHEGKTRQEILSSLISDPTRVPVSVFISQLTPLESIIKYLHDNAQLPLSKIAQKIGRSNAAISITYARAKEKFPGKAAESSVDFIPLEILTERKLSIFENIVAYLKETGNLTYHEIALLLHKDDRTIWTVYHRAQKKQENTIKKHASTQ